MMPPTSRVPCLSPNTPGPNVARAYFAPASILDRTEGMAPHSDDVDCRVRSLRSNTIKVAAHFLRFDPWFGGCGRLWSAVAAQ